MPKKNILLPFKIIDGNDGSASFNSDVVDLRYLDNISIQVIVTGDLNGTLDIEVSQDFDDHLSTGTFTKLDSSLQATINEDGSGIFDLTNLGPVYLRLAYTRTSGTSGTITAYIAGKAVS